MEQYSSRESQELRGREGTGKEEALREEQAHPRGIAEVNASKEESKHSGEIIREGILQ